MENRSKDTCIIDRRHGGKDLGSAPWKTVSRFSKIVVVISYLWLGAGGDKEIVWLRGSSSVHSGRSTSVVFWAVDST